MRHSKKSTSAFFLNPGCNWEFKVLLQCNKKLLIVTILLLPERMIDSRKCLLIYDNVYRWSAAPLLTLKAQLIHKTFRTDVA